MATYYVNQSGGDDDATGLSEALAWKTLAKVGTDAGAGDTVLLKRGEVWRETLTVPADTMTIADYDAGALPLIKGSEVFATWTAMPAPAVAEDFEGALTAWDLVTQTNATCATSADQAFSGSKSLKCVITTAGGNGSVAKYWPAAAVDDIWVTYRMYVAADFDLTDNMFMGGLAEANDPWHKIDFYINSAEKLVVYNDIDTKGGTSAAAIPKGRWFSLRYHIKVADAGHIRAWIDDTLVVDVDSDTKAASNWGSVKVGITWTAAGQTPTAYFDYVRIGSHTTDPSVPVGYYKTGVTTLPHDGYWNSTTRLLPSPVTNTATVSPLPYHLYEGASRLGYDPVKQIAYVRCPADVDPATGTVELAQRDACVLVDTLTDCPLSNIHCMHWNATYGGAFQISAGSGHTLTDCQATYGADCGVNIDEGGADITVLRGTYLDSLQAGIQTYQAGTGIVFDGCTVGGHLSPQGLGAIEITETDGAIVRNCVLSKSTLGDAAAIKSSDNVTIQNNTLGSPTVSSERGILLTGACTGYLIEGNHVENAAFPEDAREGGINLTDSIVGTGGGGTIRYNTINDCAVGICLNSAIAASAEVLYNVITNTRTGSYGDIWLRQADGVHIHHNTCVNSLSSGIMVAAESTIRCDNTLIKNNIIYNPATVALSVDADTVDNGTGNVIDYNSYYKASGDLLSWDAVGYDASEFADYKTASEQDANSIVTDPLLTSIFHLNPTSPCINTGLVIADIGQIVVGPAPDMGRYEWQPIGGGRFALPGVMARVLR